MKKILISTLFAFALLAFLLTEVIAAVHINPNGFPNGPHYNLNIIGKKTTFTCPTLEYDEYGNPM